MIRVSTASVGNGLRGGSLQHPTQLTCHNQGCGVTFSRLDSLRRHELMHTGSEIRHPCPWCEKYQKEGAFLRKDKLNQHLRQFHRIGCDGNRAQEIFCRHEDCQCDGPEPTPLARFSSNAELHRHVRRVHKTTPFQCPVQDCSRVGGKVWFRAHDRDLHQRKEHGKLSAASLVRMNTDIDARRPANF